MNLPFRLSHKMILRTGIALGCLISVATAASLQNPAGLQGILAPEVPEDLYYEEFEFAQDDWQPWGEEVAYLMADLYEDDSLDAVGQRELINQLKAKLDQMQGYLSDPTYSPVFDGLMRLRGRFLRRVTLAEAILDTLELTPEVVQQQKREELLTAVKSAVSEITEGFQSKGTPGAGSWLSYFQTENLAGLTVESENLTELLTKIQGQFQAREELAEEQLTFVNDNFLGLSAAIDTTLEQWDVSPVENFDLEKLRGDLADLVETVELYEETNHAEYAEAVKNLAASFGASSLDNGERIKKVLRSHYLNYNVVIQISEKFMSKLVSDPQTKNSPINESMGGARVSGSSTTNHNRAIDIKPSANNALFDILAKGTVNTNTTSRTSQATIRTAGTHTFTARQSILFDGDQLNLQGQSSIQVNPSYRTTGISTVADGGLFANEGRRRARSAIAARLPQARQRARTKITNQVMPEFNQKVPESIADMNKKLNDDFLTPLKEKDLFPVARHLSSSESIMQLSNSLIPEKKLGGDVPNVTLPYGEGALIQLHESAINNMLEQLELAGRQMTEAEVKEEIETKMSSFLGKDFKFSNGEEEPAAEGDAAKEETIFIFDDHDPIRVQFTGNEVRLILRTGFKRTDKEDIETNVITIPVLISMNESNIILEHGNIVPVPASGKLSIGQTNVIKKKMNDAFPKRTRAREMSRETSDGKTIKIYVESLKSLNGWLMLKVK